MINVAKEFSKYPGGRFREDGDYSGERFRDDVLIPALQQNSKVIVELDGTLGFGSSFLEEAFGGLVRVGGFDSQKLSDTLALKTENDILRYTIQRYISEAKPEVKPAKEAVS